MKINVLDDIGFVELVDHMGDDLRPVNAARVSYAKQSFSYSERDRRLLNRLLREGHGSPLEHCVFQFRVKAPLFVVRQWERHRIASYNEQSGRYAEMEPEFYAPDPVVERASRVAYRFYRLLLKTTSKETARIVLPLNLYTSFWWTVNARSLLNFLELRNSDHAQHEIRAYAQVIEGMFAEVLPGTYKAFTENGRVAP